MRALKPTQSLRLLWLLFPLNVDSFLVLQKDRAILCGIEWNKKHSTLTEGRLLHRERVCRRVWLPLSKEKLIAIKKSPSSSSTVQLSTKVSFDEGHDSHVNLIDESVDENPEVYQLDNSLEYPQAVARTLERIQKTVKTMVDEITWKPHLLEEEFEGKAQLQAAVELVEHGLIEREQDARLVVLALLSKEHILLLGKPGTAKSILGRRLSQLCSDAGDTFFQRLLTRFTTPEELFGPLSLKGLENDEYRRCTAGFLPCAKIGFLDEIFKANSAILNTLLTILNERKFDNAGGHESCPLLCVVGASNELPESDELVALFDRFLIRKEVIPVSDEGVVQLLSSNDLSSPPEAPDTHHLEHAIHSCQTAAESVMMERDVCELMRDLRTYLREEQNIEISDRRLVKASKLLQMSAASDGRRRVDFVDFLLLQHCFWNEPSQLTIIREWLWQNLTPANDDVRFLLDSLQNEVLVILRATGGSVNRVTTKKQDAVIKAIREEVGRLVAILQQRLDALARHVELLRRLHEFLWIEPQDALAMQQLLLPRAERVFDKVEAATQDAYALQLSLTANEDGPPDEVRRDIVQQLWTREEIADVEFSEMELAIGAKEAKAKYELETFRKWKRVKKKAKRRQQ